MTSHGRQEPTVIVARRARPGREREFERWLRRVVLTWLLMPIVTRRLDPWLRR